MILERRRHLENLSLLQFQKFQTLGFLKNCNKKELSQLAKSSLALVKGCALDTLTGDEDKIVKKMWGSTMYVLLVSQK